jgi:hypothetical protein
MTENMSSNSSVKINETDKKIHKNDGKVLRADPSPERKFGMQMRRLIKLVCQAFLNPSES